MPTAATEVTLGSSTPIRDSVRARSRGCSVLASSQRHQQLRDGGEHEDADVFPTAFQKWSSTTACGSWRGRPSGGRRAGSSRAARPRRCSSSGNSAEDREDQEERRDEQRSGAPLLVQAPRQAGAAATGRGCGAAGRRAGVSVQSSSGSPREGAGGAVGARAGCHWRRGSPPARRSRPGSRLGVGDRRGPAGGGVELALLDAAQGVLDRVAHRLVLGAEVDRLQAGRPGHEDLADRGVAEVLVGRVLQRRVVVEPSGRTAGCRPP